MSTTAGNRRPDGTPLHQLKPGEYAKQENGIWSLCLPSGHHGEINDGWDVVEHDEGVITVTPSIKTSTTVDGQEVELWHGYLTNGVWTPC